MKCIFNGKIVLPDRIVENECLVFDTKIASIQPECPTDAECIDAGGAYVLPGLVDIHIHGYLGEDASDAKPEGLKIMAEGVLKNGVTSFLPTTMTVSLAELTAAFDAIRSVMQESKTWNGAEILGVHAEGPFINPSKKGAQAADHILAPYAGFVLDNLDIMRIITLAPEMDPNMRAIREIVKNSNVLVSMGHTGADFATALEGIAAGCHHSTHLFNAQSPLQHRDPGVVGASLMSDEVSCELIADTFHVNPSLYKLVWRMKGKNTNLITDCTRAGGLPDGTYSLGGQPIFVKGIECRLEDGTIAGSVLKLNNAVYNFMKHADIPLYEAVAAASYYPACAIHADDRKGSLLPERDADIVIADDTMNILKVFRGGNLSYEA